MEIFIDVFQVVDYRFYLRIETAIQFKMIIFFFISFVIFLILINPAPLRGNWMTASRESANLVAPPALDRQAKVQIYTAKAFAWRGKFSVHTWIATKEKDAASYLVYHAALWNLYRGQFVVSVEKDLPDRYWYGAKPEIIFEVTGKKAEEMIPKIYEVIEKYPYMSLYRAYPGPNSNTFVSFVMRAVPGFNIALPSNAIGKDWLCGGKFFALTESISGVQISFYGLFGVSVGVVEGIEINIIGLNFGIDFLRPALKLPIVGRVGVRSKK